MINKILKGIVTLIYVAGILLLGAGLLVSFNNYKNLAMTLITLGAFLCMFFHFVTYKEAIKKNDSINTKKAFFRLVAMLVMLGLALLQIFLNKSAKVPITF